MTPEEKAALQKKFEAMLSSDSPQAPSHDSDKESVESGNNKQVPERHDDSCNQAAETLRINAKSEYVEITNIRLFSMEELDLSVLSECTSLSLRKNLIHELSPLPLPLAERLDCLDLFDNKIRKLGSFFTTAVSAIEGGALAPQHVPCPFSSLTKLDLSYNQIKKIAGLDALAGTLKELYLVENKIKTIEGLDSLVNLELLELGGNGIRDIGNGLAKLVNLQQLWLGKNKIKSIGTSLHNLKSLTLISLQANRITEVSSENFLETAHPVLRELYLSENGIEVIENLPLHTLRTLDVSFNPIKTISAEVVNTSNFPLLEEFWLTDGKLDNWEDVAKLAPFEKTLRTVYLERNPIEQDKRYRDKVYMHLPFVTQIDSWPVVNKGNLEADRAIQRRS